jgi:hypothetical protein
MQARRLALGSVELDLEARDRNRQHRKCCGEDSEEAMKRRSRKLTLTVLGSVWAGVLVHLRRSSRDST